MGTPPVSASTHLAVRRTCGEFRRAWREYRGEDTPLCVVDGVPKERSHFVPDRVDPHFAILRAAGEELRIRGKGYRDDTSCSVFQGVPEDWICPVPKRVQLHLLVVGGAGVLSRNAPQSTIP